MESGSSSITELEEEGHTQSEAKTELDPEEEVVEEVSDDDNNQNDMNDGDVPDMDMEIDDLGDVEGHEDPEVDNHMQNPDGMETLDYIPMPSESKLFEFPDIEESDEEKEKTDHADRNADCNKDTKTKFVCVLVCCRNLLNSFPQLIDRVLPYR